MTRNTKLYKVDGFGEELVYRTLTVEELVFLDGISNEYHKYENAVKLALVEGNIYELKFTVISEIGRDIIRNSRSVMVNDELFKVTVQEFRMKSKEDPCMNMILSILNIVPGMTYEFLINQTYTDLIELMCLAERISNKKLMNISNTTQQPEGPAYLPDDDSGKSLQDKIKEDMKWYKDE